MRCGGSISTRPSIPSNKRSVPVGRLNLRIVVPITGWRPDFDFLRWFVRLDPSTENGLSKVSGADTFQVKSLSLDRFRTRMGILTPEQTANIAAAIAESVGA